MSKITDINCRGRNGWFKFNRLKLNVGTEPGYVWVSIYSKQFGKMPPIVFDGPPEEIALLFRHTADEIEERAGEWRL